MSKVPDILSFDDITATDGSLVGGKALNLAQTLRAGLPVPAGFCITTAAYLRLSQPAIHLDSSFSTALAEAYRELGDGLVAVRSSATAEDGTRTSFAGQQETILGVEGLKDLQEAVQRCWRSLHTERARAYRDRQGVQETEPAIAVVVQRLVDAEVAGVLFTRDPLDATGSLMRVEASWGLGEAVVSGRVTPDRYQIERDTGQVRDRQPGDKHVQLGPTGEQSVSVERRNRLCLTDRQLDQLAKLGRQVESYFGDARDIEWAIASDTLWLLQARPITTTAASERERIREAEIDRLKKIADGDGVVWSRTNLIEVLPEPTPMTWSLVSGLLLSGGGGTGAMYRDFGFRPDPALDQLSAYDLIGGRPYLNLCREPRLEGTRPLSGYPLSAYRQSPHLALNPKREDPRGIRKWLSILRIVGIATRIASASRTFAQEFRQTHLANFATEIERGRQDDLSKLSPEMLLKRLRTWAARTLVEFARHSLKPTLLAQFSWQVLEQQITKSLGPERAQAILAELSQGGRPDPGADLAGAIRKLAAGETSRDEFLQQFGHRGSNEMELASPRWEEAPSTLAQPRLAHPQNTVPVTGDALARLASEAKWNAMVTRSMTDHVHRLQTYLGLRETGKHHLMRGFAVLRQTLLELDRRFGLDGGIFYLTHDELPDLVTGEDFRRLIAERQKTRSIALGLEIPLVVFADDLHAIGRPQPLPVGAEQRMGIPLSAGVVEGPALVLTEPVMSEAEPGYILVCPSTDPAWVPLFVHACGLVMESGGTLSHGAIVAREFGLPAIAGIPGIVQQIRTGQRLHVDGGRGIVSLLRKE